MVKKILSDEEKRKQNLELLTNASDILSNLKIKYLLGEIENLSGSVDIDVGKFKINLKYNKVEGDAYETTE